MQRFPSHDPFNSLPSLSTIIGSIPKKGKVADPGFKGVVPAIGEIRVAPVSVCHHVSITGHFLFPTTS